MHAASGVRCACAAAGVLFSLAAPLAAQKGTYEGIDGPQATALSHSVTLDLRDVTLREALKAVVAQGGVSLAYSSSTVPLDRRVSLTVHAVSTKDALDVLLRGTEAEVRETASGQMLLVRRPVRTQPIETAAAKVFGVLSGRVTDSASGAPVSKAVVMLDAGSNRTATNDSGAYRMVDVPPGVHVVGVRRIGYAPAERSVVVREGEGPGVDFALTRVASRLDEVVTTVTGAQRRVEVGNTIGTINADSVVREGPVMSLTDLINARVSGTQVVQSSGVTGASPRIRIRGLNSFSASNDPLLVVDGARAENSTAALGGLSSAITPGRLNDINPDEIESVEIIKGPAAATLYGTDAANGVILIRTKRGQPGRAHWSAHVERGLVDQSSPAPDNYYRWGRNTQTNAVQQCVLVSSAAGTCAADSLSRFNPFKNSATTPLATGYRNEYGVQVAGGVSQFVYFLAANREAETGYLRMPASEEARLTAERGVTTLPPEQTRPNALERTNLRANFGVPAGMSADVSVSTGIISSDVRTPTAVLLGNGYTGRGYRDAQDGWANFRPGDAFAIRNREASTRFTSSLVANWRPLTWLTGRGTIGIDNASAYVDALQLRDEGPSLGTQRLGRRLDTRTDATQLTTDLGISALFTPRSALSSRTSAGVQYNRRAAALTTASGSDLLPGAQTVASAATITAAEQTVETIVAGTYVEHTLGINERLFLTAALRADGASAFGHDFRTALYPKASVSWLALEWSQGWFGALRLRAAYGASGVMPDATASVARVALSPALVNGVTTTGAIAAAIGNPALRPERQAEFETGFDADLFGVRLRVEGTFYDRLSHDALVDRPMPAELGIASRQENIGSVRNRGIEGLIAATLMERPALTWGVTVNGSVNQNRLEQLAENVPFVGTASQRNQVGFPLFSRFEQPILTFQDANGNNVIEPTEVRVGPNREYLGATTPPRQLSASSAVALFNGRLRLTTQFDYRGGNVVLNSYASAGCSTGISNCRAVNDPTASLEAQAAAVARNLPPPFQTNAGFVQDGSFIRWRELSMTYAVPERLLASMGGRTASVVLSARNLRLFSNYSGADPEVSTPTPTGPRVEGAAEGTAFPPSRYWLLRLNITI